MRVKRHSVEAEEEADMDKKLLDLWSQWKQYASADLSNEDAAKLDWVEGFCIKARDRLILFRLLGRTEASTHAPNQSQK